MRPLGWKFCYYLWKNRTRYKRKKEQTKGCRNSVHKYKTYFQAERIIYLNSLWSTSIFCLNRFLINVMSLSYRAFYI
jgi:hypothetical protein